jgi:hypothetical protein
MDGLKTWLKSFLDYREYLHYYKAIIVLILGSLVHIRINNNVSYVMRLVIEFIGIKYWVFKNKLSDTKGLKKEILLFLTLKIFLLIFDIIMPKIGYWNIIHDKINKPIETKVRHLVEKYEKTQFITIETVVENIFLVLLNILSMSFISFPIYRYFIFKIK